MPRRVRVSAGVRRAPLHPRQACGRRRHDRGRTAAPHLRDVSRPAPFPRGRRALSARRRPRPPSGPARRLHRARSAGRQLGRSSARRQPGRRRRARSMGHPCERPRALRHAPANDRRRHAPVAPPRAARDAWHRHRRHARARGRRPRPAAAARRDRRPLAAPEAVRFRAERQRPGRGILGTVWGAWT